MFSKAVGKGGGAGWNQFQMITKSMVFLGYGTGFARVSCTESYKKNKAAEKNMNWNKTQAIKTKTFF